MKNKHKVFAPTRILIPTDLSPGGLVALRLGIEMANKFNSHVDVISIYEELPKDVYGDVRLYDTEVVKEVREQIHTALNKVKISQKVKERIRIFIRKGKAADIICRHAENHLTDIVVMASHGRVGLQRIRYGSVTEAVIKKCKSAVLAIKPTSKNRSFNPKEVLLPLDFSNRDLAALAFGRKLQESFKSKLHTFHTIPNLSLESLNLEPPKTLLRSCKERIQGSLRRLEIKATVAVTFGDPVNAIVEEALNKKNDLILIPTRSKKQLLFGLLGSVSAQVARYSPCDVLTLPS